MVRRRIKSKFTGHWIDVKFFRVDTAIDTERQRRFLGKVIFVVGCRNRGDFGLVFGDTYLDELTSFMRSDNGCLLEIADRYGDTC